MVLYVTLTVNLDMMVGDLFAGNNVQMDIQIQAYTVQNHHQNQHVQVICVMMVQVVG
jgi:hypothetical protein